MITSFFASKKKRALPIGEESSSNKRPASAGSSSTEGTATSNAPTPVASLLTHFPTSSESISWHNALRTQLKSRQFQLLAGFVEKERFVLFAFSMTWFNFVRYDNLIMNTMVLCHIITCQSQQDGVSPAGNGILRSDQDSIGQSQGQVLC